jgi:electron transfer flavoprotein beta subunit
MKIIVCIKQVPATQNVQIDPKTGSLMRWAATTKMNPFDLVALEAALQLKDRSSAEITVITMGPNAAKAVLTEALSMGADKGILISDKAFAGADVLATSHTLSYAIEALKIDYDLLLCGQQTTDGDTAQVGPSIAALLNIPHISYVRKLISNPNTFTVESIINDDRLIAEIKKPCLLTIDKDFAQARYPSYWKLIETINTPIQIITLADLKNPDTINHIGQAGSPTSVLKIYPPVHEVISKKLSGKSKDIVNELVDYLKDEHLIERNSHE